MKKSDIQLFCELEKKYDLFSLEYNDVHFWQLIRSEIFRLLSRSGDVAISATTISRSSKIVLIIQLIQEILKRRSRLLKNCKILRVNVNYPGDFISEEGVIDRAFQNMYLEKSFDVQDIFVNCNGEVDVPNIVTFPYKELQILIMQWLNSFRKSFCLGESIEKTMNAFLIEANELFGKDLKIKYLIRCAKRTTDEFILLKKCYYKVFDLTKPQIVLLNTAIDINCLAITKNAQERNIPVVEMTHGFSFFHDAYTYGDDSDVGKIVPNYIFTYGDFFTKGLHMPKNVKYVSVGNPYLEEQVKRYPDNMDEKTIAIFSEDAGYGVFLSKELVKCMPKLNEKGYKVLYKFHPNERNGVADYPWLSICSGIDYFDSKTSPYEVISKARVIVSFDSTVLIESFVYPGRKIINYISKKTDFSVALSSMGIVTVTNESEFFSELEKVFGVHDESIWKKNATENVRYELEHILESRI